MGRYGDGYQAGYEQAQFEQSLQGLPHNGIGPKKSMVLGCGFIYSSMPYTASPGSRPVHGQGPFSVLQRPPSL